MPLNLTFDHIGLVVADIEGACRQMAKTLGLSHFTDRFDDKALGVSVCFGRDASGTVYEFISPLGEKSPVARALETKTNLLNQVAYVTPSLAESAAALRAAGNFPLGSSHPARAFGGAPVQFFLSPLGFVIELIEASGHRHDFSETLG